MSSISKRVFLTTIMPLVLGSVLLMGGLVLMLQSHSYAQNIVISEIRVDQPSTDNDEYFELAGTPGQSLDGVTYLVIGDYPSGTIECAVDLSGHAISTTGYFVVAEATFSLSGTPDLVTSLNFENSDNVTHLLVEGFTGAVGDDIDPNKDCVQDVYSYTLELDRVALIDDVGPPSGDCYYGPPTIGPDGSYPPSHAWQCTLGWNMGTYVLGPDDTPGGPASGCPDSNAVDIVSVEAASGSLPVLAMPAMLGLGGALIVFGLVMNRRRK